MLKVVAHASPPLNVPPGFRQYDLFIDGQTFFSMPKVFELGIRGGPTSPTVGPRYAGAPDYAAPPAIGYNNYSSSRGVGGYASAAAPRSASQEEEDLKRAIAVSLEESRRHLSGERSRSMENGGGGGYAPEEVEPKEDLLDFSNEPPAPAPLPALPAPPVQDTANMLVSYQVDNRQYPGAPATNSYDSMSYTSAPPAYGAPPPQQQQQYAMPQIQNGPPQQYAPQPPVQQPQPPVQDQFAPVQTTYDQFAPQMDDPFAPKPPPPPSRDAVNSAVRL